jgi:hypothetical protein
LVCFYLDRKSSAVCRRYGRINITPTGPGNLFAIKLSGRNIEMLLPGRPIEFLNELLAVLPTPGGV